MEKKTFAVLGMMCAGCAANVERRLNLTEGVASAAVNLPAEDEGGTCRHRLRHGGGGRP